MKFENIARKGIDTSFSELKKEREREEEDKIRENLLQKNSK